MDIELKEFILAKERIKSTLHHTQTEYSLTLSEMTGGDIYLKCENHQKTGSFKIRGATNKIAKMIENGDKSPVIASSAGNHAQGVAHAAKNYGLKATIVMPKNAPLTKVEATKGYGAEVVLCGEVYDDAYNKACELCEEINAKFVHPYNDLDIIAGQGTIGLEIMNDLSDVDIVIVPAGGGGMLAGVATAIKKINSEVKVYGVQAKNANAIALSFDKKELVETKTANTIADGIAVKKPGDVAFELIKNNVDGILTVSESDISNAVLLLIERCKEVVEPAGATPVAALISKQIDVKNKKVVCVTSGGNIDVTCINSIIEKGLVARHRRIELLVTTKKQSSIKPVVSLIEDEGGNIITLELRNSSLMTKDNESLIYIACETSGLEHEEKIIEKFIRNGYRISLPSADKIMRD